jgi:ureidoglycolate lyase
VENKDFTTIKAMPLTEENFAPYGKYVKVMEGEGRTGEGGWRAWMSQDVCMEVPANIGFTQVGGMPLIVDSMEVHNLTTEFLACGNKPIVLAVADSDPYAAGARAADIRAFIIQPGEFVVLDKGIWHDACRSAEGDECYYYFMAQNLEVPEFIPILGEAVRIEL